MENDFTLDELAHFTQHEQEFLAKLGVNSEEQDLIPDDLFSPSQRAVDHILNYSLALSVRPSRMLGHIELLNN